MIPAPASRAMLILVRLLCNGTSSANLCTGQSQGSCSIDQEHIPPPSPYDLSSVATSPVDVCLVAGSDSPEFGPISSASNASSPCRVSSHVIDLTLDEGTENTPISIEVSPVRARPCPTLAPRSHIPFQPLPLVRRKRLKNKASPDAPFPDASMQHVRDSVMGVQATPIDLARRQRGTGECPPDRGPCMPLKQIPTADEIANGHVRCHRRVPPSERQADANAVLSCHGDIHPAISSVFGLASEIQGVKETSQQHWNHKWRPRRAEHVLGNEHNACYLREWMHALRLHFDTASSSNIKMTKSKRNYKKRKRTEQRPEVVREVTRKRQRAGDLDGWMVDDDDDDDDINEDHEIYEDFSDCSLPSSRDLREPLTVSFGRKIRNTILLVGPPGCGKTAAVYACAEELGWNVFEVYPGVGKRGGTHLDDLIGDVGKNHTLPQPLLFHHGRSEHPSPAKKSSKNGVDPSNKLAEAEVHPQSVVLIEEADVVFADEAGFWPSIVAFIKGCRRPIIITCNGEIIFVSYHLQK
jgi:ATPase family associated with various cellular activities (AAA)